MNGNFEDKLWIYFVPVANTAIVIKSIFMGTIKAEIFALLCVANLIYSAAILWVTAKLFQQEDIAFGGLSDIIFQKSKKHMLGIWDSLLMFGICLLVYFYIGAKLQKNNLHVGVICSQILFLLLPVIIAAKQKKLSITKLFRLHKASPLDYLLAPFLGIAALVIANILGNWQSIIVPTPPEVAAATANMVHFSDLQQGILVFAAVAVTPAIFEELFFRGYIMTGFQSRIKGFWLYLFTGFAFAAFHMNAYNLLALTFMGTAISAVACLTGSIFPAMIMHVTINGIQIIMEYFNWNVEPHMIWLIPLSLILLVWFFITRRKGETAVEP